MSIADPPPMAFLQAQIFGYFATKKWKEVLFSFHFIIDKLLSSLEFISIFQYDVIFIESNKINLLFIK